MTRLEQQMQFIMELDKMKQIGRQTYLADGSRKENDAEHSWHLAVMAMLLTEYATEPVDKLHVIMMVLVHDVIEVDAGDTYAYDTEAAKTKRQRELLAADHLFSMLPEDQGRMLRALWDEFEENVTPEARFAHALDNVQPISLNHASGGLGWREHHVKKSQIYGRNAHTAEGSETLWNMAKAMVDQHVESGDVQDA